MKAIRPLLLLVLVWMSSNLLHGQVITTVYVDVLGNQPVLVDTMTSGYPKNELFTKSAEKQFAIGFRMCGLNLERNLHVGIQFAYRKVVLENLNLLNASNVNKYEKEGLYEFMGGITYFTKRGLPLGKMRCHFTANAHGGVQNLSFGSTMGAGLTMLHVDGLAGITIEFVYRPVAYEIDNKSGAFDPDRYYVTLLPSYALKVGLSFGRNLEYN